MGALLAGRRRIDTYRRRHSPCLLTFLADIKTYLYADFYWPPISVEGRTHS